MSFRDDLSIQSSNWARSAGVIAAELGHDRFVLGQTDVLPGPQSVDNLETDELGKQPRAILGLDAFELGVN